MKEVLDRMWYNLLVPSATGPLLLQGTGWLKDGIHD
jgi:hypothetical protein